MSSNPFKRSFVVEYKKVGKKLHLVHLSPECLEILDTAKDMVEVNLLEDPKYHIADDKLA